MADWKTVRFDPTYEEKLDEEIIPLCDALNAAGFVTTYSCCGHGSRSPKVWFEHSSDERIEHLARFVLAEEKRLTELPENRLGEQDAQMISLFPYSTDWQKETLLDGYIWSVAIHLTHAYMNTPPAQALEWATDAIAAVAKLVEEWHQKQAAKNSETLPGANG